VSAAHILTSSVILAAKLLRYNALCYNAVKRLREVCHDFTVESLLQAITGESLPTSANSSEDARLEVAARGFWTTGQLAKEEEV